MISGQLIFNCHTTIVSDNLRVFAVNSPEMHTDDDWIDFQQWRTEESQMFDKHGQLQAVGAAPIGERSENQTETSLLALCP
jgi:hypothetical protein